MLPFRRATTGPQRSSTPPPTSPARISKRSRWTARSTTCCVEDAPGRRVDDERLAQSLARSLRAPVAWQCPHQLVARILNRIGERAERLGDIAWALRAAELRLVLPFEAARASAWRPSCAACGRA